MQRVGRSTNPRLERAQRRVGYLAALCALVGPWVPAQAAEPSSQSEGIAWLKKIADASRQANFSGTIVYQHRGQVETSRVVRFVNPAGGVFEKLEALDGPPREVIRANDQVTCYLPKSKLVIIEERNRSTRNFPALLPESLEGIAENYRIRNEGVDRIAGHDCQWISLMPRDNLRYGRRFCAELASALPLRAQTVGEKGEILESFAFTQLTIGGVFSRDRVKSKYAERSRAQNWRIDRAGLTAAATPADTGWSLTSTLPGFRKMTEARRSLGGRSGTVSQIVFSDGLAAISIFIEQLSAAPAAPSLTHQGAVNIYTRAQGGHAVTVLGEVPAAAIMQIANSLELRPVTSALPTQ